MSLTAPSSAGPQRVLSRASSGASSPAAVPTFNLAPRPVTCRRHQRLRNYSLCSGGICTRLIRPPNPWKIAALCGHRSQSPAANRACSFAKGTLSLKLQQGAWPKMRSPSVTFVALSRPKFPAERVSALPPPPVLSGLPSPGALSRPDTNRIHGLSPIL